MWDDLEPQVVWVSVRARLGRKGVRRFSAYRLLCFDVSFSVVFACLELFASGPCVSSLDSRRARIASCVGVGGCL